MLFFMSKRTISIFSDVCFLLAMVLSISSFNDQFSEENRALCHSIIIALFSSDSSQIRNDFANLSRLSYKFRIILNAGEENKKCWKRHKQANVIELNLCIKWFHSFCEKKA